MCFKLGEGDSRRMRRAKEDIPCWKTVLITREGDILSQYNAFDYLLGVAYSKRINLWTLIEFWFMGRHEGNEEGFHSYSQAVTSMGCTTVECVIPKGSYYYESKQYREYFSTGIKLVQLTRMK